MARSYAGTLGYLAMSVTLLRGAIHGAGFGGTVMQGLAAMAAMAVVGAVVGAVAQQTVDSSVRASLEGQLAEGGQAAAAKA